MKTDSLDKFVVIVDRPKKGRVIFGVFSNERDAQSWIETQKQQHPKWKRFEMLTVVSPPGIFPIQSEVVK